MERGLLSEKVKFIGLSVSQILVSHSAQKHMEHLHSLLHRHQPEFNIQLELKVKTLSYLWYYYRIFS